MFDLYRHINVQLENINVEEKVSDLWRDMFMEVIDDMQLKIDEKKMSSEIHVVLDVSK